MLSSNPYNNLLHNHHVNQWLAYDTPGFSQELTLGAKSDGSRRTACLQTMPTVKNRLGKGQQAPGKTLVGTPKDHTADWLFGALLAK